MENRELRIGQGSVEVFLIRDESFKEAGAPFFDWLFSEGFKRDNLHPQCIGNMCVYINITRKQFSYSKTGVALARIIGNHSITIDEFKTIYNIYKRFEAEGQSNGKQ